MRALLLVDHLNDGCSCCVATERVSKISQINLDWVSDAQPYFSNDLWAEAATQLCEQDKLSINFSRTDRLNILEELYTEAERCKQKSHEKRWKFTRNNGEIVIIRDVFGKLVRWIDVFKQIGDVAVQYDAGHASLPWAAVRFVLQVCSIVLVREEATDVCR
jgi:hypothetical protein